MIEPMNYIACRAEYGTIPQIILRRYTMKKPFIGIALTTLTVSSQVFASQVCRLTEDGGSPSGQIKAENRFRLENMMMDSARYIGSVGTVSVVVDNSFNDAEANKVLNSVKRLYETVYSHENEIYNCASDSAYNGGDLHGRGVRIRVWDNLFKYLAPGNPPRGGSSTTRYLGHNLYIREYVDESVIDNTAGLAFIGPQASTDYWKFNRSILLNKSKLGRISESSWAGIIAHEIMHTYWYTHPVGGYDGQFIYHYGLCVERYS